MIVADTRRPFRLLVVAVASLSTFAMTLNPVVRDWILPSGAVSIYPEVTVEYGTHVLSNSDVAIFILLGALLFSLFVIHRRNI